MAGISAWRVNDVVAYDAMRESATILTSLLLAPASADSSGIPHHSEEIAEWRHRVLTCDGVDREAVAMLAATIEERVAELSRTPR